jgi:ABC-type transporter Mla subunit MlaD
MDDERLQLRVGGAVLVTLLMAIAFTVVILPRIDFGRHIRVQVTFGDIGGVRQGSPVIVAGQKIGEVESVLMSTSSSGAASSRLVVAVIALRQRQANRVFVSSEFFVSSHGPLSERYIEIAGRGQAEPGRPVQDGDVVRGIDPPSLDRVLQNTWTNLSVARQFLQEVTGPVNELRSSLSALGGSLDDVSPTMSGYIQLMPAAAELLTAFQELSQTTGGAATMQRTQALMASANLVVAHLQTELSNIDQQLKALQGNANSGLVKLDAAASKLVARAREVIAEVKSVMDRVGPAMANAEQLAQMLARGEGTIMRLMTDPEFPEDSRDLGKILKRTPWRVVGHAPDSK